jgi:hypothetical protein
VLFARVTDELCCVFVQTTVSMTVATQPLNEDVTACLHDDIASLRSLMLSTSWLLKTSATSAPAPAATTAAAAAAGSGAAGGAAAALSLASLQSSARSEGELALMHLLYKIADARTMSSARMGLASGGRARPAPAGPGSVPGYGSGVADPGVPGLVLDLWTDAMSAGIALLSAASSPGHFRGSLRTPAVEGVRVC